MILRDKDKQAIIDIAQKSIHQPSRLLAFGSRVNGEAHDTSDLDLVLVTDNNEKINIDDFINFRELLKESNIPIIIQVLDWNRIPESFHENILNNNCVLTNINN